VIESSHTFLAASASALSVAESTDRTSAARVGFIVRYESPAIFWYVASNSSPDGAENRSW